MEKLRECPYCGGIPAQDIIKDSYYRKRYTIECGTCGLQMWDIAKDSLYRSWNTRHEQKNETVEEWINVKDRLPEHGQNVLAWQPEIPDITSAAYEDERFVDIFGMLNNVTHWQPLPEPPEERAGKPEERDE